MHLHISVGTGPSNPSCHHDLQRCTHKRAIDLMSLGRGHSPPSSSSIPMATHPHRTPPYFLYFSPWVFFAMHLSCEENKVGYCSNLSPRKGEQTAVISRPRQIPGREASSLQGSNGRQISFRAKPRSRANLTVSPLPTRKHSFVPLEREDEDSSQ